MKQSIFLLGMLAAFGIVSCNSEAANNKINIMNMRHDHTKEFSCPMHPKIRGKEGETCPKCGIRLEKAAVPDNTSYFVTFTTSANAIEPGKELILSFVPKTKR